jgi:hypothetical protein
MRGEPMISFAAHEVRAGAGAHGDFEKMLAQLVTVVEGEQAQQIHLNPGDWGIDVMVGDLRGAVRVWQAKYFRPGTTQKHQQQIRESFASAMRAATEHGYAITEWVLCIPSSMDGATTQWWKRWAPDRKRATGVNLTLWDETKLRELLFRPEATPVRHAFYGRYRDPADPDEARTAKRFPDSPAHHTSRAIDPGAAAT